MSQINTENALLNKARIFAVDIVKLHKHLTGDFREYEISAQLKRSGTSIMANVAESKFAQSRPDFINKLSIALKEANESIEWLSLLHNTDYINTETYTKLHSQCEELLRMLVCSIKTCKSKINK